MDVQCLAHKLLVRTVQTSRNAAQCYGRNLETSHSSTCLDNVGGMHASLTAKLMNKFP